MTDELQKAIDCLRAHGIQNGGCEELMAFETIVKAAQQPAPEAVTVEEYETELLACRQLRKEYVPSAEFISNRYPSGIRIVKEKE